MNHIIIYALPMKEVLLVQLPNLMCMVMIRPGQTIMLKFP